MANPMGDPVANIFRTIGRQIKKIMPDQRLRTTHRDRETFTTHTGNNANQESPTGHQASVTAADILYTPVNGNMYLWRSGTIDLCAYWQDEDYAGCFLSWLLGAYPECAGSWLAAGEIEKVLMPCWCQQESLPATSYIRVARGLRRLSETGLTTRRIMDVRVGGKRVTATQWLIPTHKKWLRHLRAHDWKGMDDLVVTWVAPDRK